MKEFPDLTEKWFIETGITADPEGAAKAWKAWVSRQRAPKDEAKLDKGKSERLWRAKLKKALELAVGVSPGAVGHYLSRDRREKLGEQTLKELDAVCSLLGESPADRPKARPEISKRGPWRIVLLTDLSEVPSPRYHLEVLRAIIRAGLKSNFTVAVHEVRHSSDSELSSATARIVRNSRPHGIIWFRLSPNRSCLEELEKFSKVLPSVVLHGSRLRYPRPVIGHVIPFQNPIRRAIELWARGLPESPAGDVIVATMPREELNSDLPEIEGVPTSIRNERIDLIVAGLDDAGLTANVVTVKSYLASQALEIYQKHPSARAYVCLSDELAVGIRQLLFATGQDPSNRIVGFDDSELADAYGITSISQHLTDLGEVIQRVFMTFFREQAGGAPWPEFQECCIQTQLTLRGY